MVLWDCSLWVRSLVCLFGGCPQLLSFLPLENSSVLICYSQMPSLTCCAPNVCVPCSNTCIQATCGSSCAWHDVPFLPILLTPQIYVNATAWLRMNKLCYALLRLQERAMQQTPLLQIQAGEISQGRMFSKAEGDVAAKECRAAPLLGQGTIVSSKWGQRRYIGLY